MIYNSTHFCLCFFVELVFDSLFESLLPRDVDLRRRFDTGVTIDSDGECDDEDCCGCRFWFWDSDSVEGEWGEKERVTWEFGETLVILMIWQSRLILLLWLISALLKVFELLNESDVLSELFNSVDNRWIWEFMWLSIVWLSIIEELSSESIISSSSDDSSECLESLTFDPTNWISVGCSWRITPVDMLLGAVGS
jgi:hypothetical protein